MSLLAETSPPLWPDQLLQWLGYDFSRLPPGAQVELQWANFPASWGVFVLLAALAGVLYGVFWLYRREIDTCPRWAKLLLASLRAGVVLLLAVIFLGPALVYRTSQTIEPTLVIARDASQSMNTADRYHADAAAQLAASALGESMAEVRSRRPTRTQLMNQLLDAERGPLVGQLRERGKLRVLDFSDEVAALTLPQQAKERPALPPLTATGRGTDLGLAIREALAADSPAAVVLLTDGQHTAPDDPRVAAREAKQRGVPLLIVGLGDPSQPRNLKVANIYVRPQVWQNEPFEVEAMIAAQAVAESGAAAREVRVELIEQRVSDSDAAVGSGTDLRGTVVATEQLAIPAAGGRLPVQFSHTAKESGRFVYGVRVETIEEELADDDNQAQSAVVKVLSREKVRVLLVAGAPTWEFRLVEKLLARDDTMVVSCWLQTLDEERAQEGTRQITELPTTREGLFWYDVVLLFDPNPQEFDHAWIELLKQFVGEHSGGLLFMAGPKHSGRLLTNARTSELQKVLPVSFGDVGALEVAALLSTNQQAWPLKLVQANVDHPVMRFYADRQQTLQRWETLPGIFWSFPSQGAKPTAQVLLEHSDPTLRSVEGSRPLLVAGRYGSGHTLYLGFNGTWRWRRAGRQAEFFDKFWVQSIRYLVEGRSLEGRRRGFVQTDRDRYEIGEKIIVTARLQDATYNPLSLPQVEATLHVGGETPQTVVLRPMGQEPGRYEATLIARHTGVHTLRVLVPSAGDADGEAIETPFTVELPSVETNQVWLDKPLLVDLARLSGGEYFDVHETNLLAASVPDKIERIEVRGKPDPLWDKRGMLIALVALLSLEWIVRKRFKLL